LAAILAGLLVARPAIATAPYNQIDSEYVSENLIIKDNAIIAPRNQSSVGQGSSKASARPAEPSGRHSTRAEKTIPVEKLRAYLEEKGSPLAPYASNILASPYWSTILGICTIEQYGCTKGPNFNLWGIMCGSGRVCAYKSWEESIEAIHSLLTKYEARGKDTIEELNGYYVVPASQNWFNVVLKTKQHVEAL
jgi:hypothetical protein